MPLFPSYYPTINNVEAKQDVASIADQLADLDQALYEIYGRGHQKKAAEAIGEKGVALNQVLAPSRREMIRKLEAHVREVSESDE